MFNFFRKNNLPPKSLGQRGEEFAQEHYRSLGFKIVGANEYNRRGKRLGEIDFIAANANHLVFVEVKTRSVLASDRFGTAAEAVNAFKQVKLLRAVKAYLLQHSEFGQLTPRIDVCVVGYSELDKPSFSATIIVNAVEDWS